MAADGIPDVIDVPAPRKMEWGDSLLTCMALTSASMLRVSSNPRGLSLWNYSLIVAVHSCRRRCLIMLVVRWGGAESKLVRGVASASSLIVIGVVSRRNYLPARL